MSGPARDGSGSVTPAKLDYAPPAERGFAALQTDYVRPFTCPYCGSVSRVRASLVGRPIICWGCEAPVTIAEPSAVRFDGEAGEAARVRLSRLRCLFCGYPLAGLPENTCPECGHRFDLDAITPANRRSARDAGTTILSAVGLILIALLLLSIASLIFGG